MTTYTMIVRVNVEREEGLHASREDIQERLSDAIFSAIEEADLEALGPRAESSYSAETEEVSFIQKKEEKQIWTEYDESAAEDYPGDEFLVKEASTLRRKIAALTAQNGAMAKALKKREQEEKAVATRIFQDDRMEGGPVVYLKDGKYDTVCFTKIPGAERHGGIQIRMLENGALEVRNNSMDDELHVLPRSGNEVWISLHDRR